MFSSRMKLIYQSAEVRSPGQAFPAAPTCFSSAWPPSCGWSLRHAVTTGSACCSAMQPSRCSEQDPSWANAAGRRGCLLWQLWENMDKRRYYHVRLFTSRNSWSNWKQVQQTLGKSHVFTFLCGASPPCRTHEICLFRFTFSSRFTCIFI